MATPSLPAPPAFPGRVPHERLPVPAVATTVFGAESAPTEPFVVEWQLATTEERR